MAAQSMNSNQQISPPISTTPAFSVEVDSYTFKLANFIETKLRKQLLLQFDSTTPSDSLTTQFSNLGVHGSNNDTPPLILNEGTISKIRLERMSGYPSFEVALDMNWLERELAHQSSMYQLLSKQEIIENNTVEGDQGVMETIYQQGGFALRYVPPTPPIEVPSAGNINLPNPPKLLERPQESALNKKRRQNNHSPWVATMNWTQNYSNPIEILNEELFCFLDYIRPTNQEANFRSRVMQTLELILKYTFGPSAVLQIFGSCSTGLFLPDSDIDCCVNCPEFKGRSPRSLMNRLSMNLKDMGFITTFEAVITAKVPILKMKTAPAYGSFDLDLSFDNLSGPAGAMKMRELMDEVEAGGMRDSTNAATVGENRKETLEILVLLLKLLLKGRYLNETRTGGIGGLSIFLLVVSFLQNRQEVAGSPAEILISLLRFYGFELNYSRVTITTANGGNYLNRRTKFGVAGTTGKVRMSLQHPVQLDRDMTSASYNTFKIIETFQQFHSTLHQYSSSSPEQVQEILERQESALIPIGIKLSENLISKRKSRAKEFELASQDENRFTMEYLLENMTRRETARLESAEKRKLLRMQSSEARVLGGYSSNTIKNAVRQGFMNVAPEQRQ